MKTNEKIKQSTKVQKGNAAIKKEKLRRGVKMILADKIMNLRKKCGWSQEDLAEQLNVSRQSVSKWESGASIPDLERIIAMSKLFGVSTDYLLKDDEVNEIPNVSVDVYEAPECRNVSVEEADTYMNAVAKTAKKVAAGVLMCIMSPVPMILLAALSEYGKVGLAENVAAGLGVTILMVMIAIAVAVFILCGMKTDKYEYMEKERLSLQYGVQGIVEKKKEDFADTYQKGTVIGVTLCILAVVPLFIGVAFGASDGVMVCCTVGLLTLIAVGVFTLTWVSAIQESYEKLLQEGDYTIEKKEMHKKTSPFSGAYWCVVTAIFLILGFTTNDWGKFGLIWPVAALVFVAFRAVMKGVFRRKK